MPAAAKRFLAASAYEAVPIGTKFAEPVSLPESRPLWNGFKKNITRNINDFNEGKNLRLNVDHTYSPFRRYADIKKYGKSLSLEEASARNEVERAIQKERKQDYNAYKAEKAEEATRAKEKRGTEATSKIDDALVELEKEKEKYEAKDEVSRARRRKAEIEEKTKEKDGAYKDRMAAKTEAAATAKGAKEAADKARAEKAAADKKIRDELEKAGKPVAGAPARPRPPQPVERVGDTKKASLNITELFNIQMTLTNLFQYVSFSSPILIVFFITLYSIVQDKILSGLIFNMGIVLISSIVYMLKHLLKNKQDSKASPFCNVLPSPFTIKTYDNANNTHYYYDSPSFSSSVLAFSATYLIYPMIIMNQQNVSLLVVAIVLVLINAVTEVKYGCSGLFGVILGILIGVIFAILYYSLLMSSDHTSKYLYFAEKESNNTQCRKPGTQNFRCSLYKNGVAVI